MSKLEALALALAITFAGLFIAKRSNDAVADKYAAEYAEDDALTEAAERATNLNVTAEVTFKARLTQHGWVVVATERGYGVTQASRSLDRALSGCVSLLD